MVTVGCSPQESPETDNNDPNEIPSGDILWWYDLKAPSFSSAALEDIDGDGKPEIVFGTYINDEHVYVLNAEDGTLLWRYETGGKADTAPAIADVDGDGSLEVIVCVSSTNVVYCFNGSNGTVEWTFSTGDANEIESSPAIADLDNDELPEIVFGTLNGHFYCLNGEDATIRWYINLGIDSNITAEPNILDLDGDGLLEVITAQAGGNNRIYALTGHDGSTLWFSDLPQNDLVHGASFADIDKDGKPEIIIGSTDHHIYALNGEDGTLKWDYTTTSSVGAPTSIADLNHDDHYEIVFTASNSNLLGVLSSDGQLLWSYRASGSILRGAIISDTNNDGSLDLVFVSDNGILHILSGDNGRQIRTFHLASHYGRQVWVDHAPVVADFDKDGKLDIFIVVGSINSANPGANLGRAYALRAGSGTGPVWKTFRHDHRHSGTSDNKTE